MFENGFIDGCVRVCMGWSVFSIFVCLLGCLCWDEFVNLKHVLYEHIIK